MVTRHVERRQSLRRPKTTGKRAQNLPPGRRESQALRASRQSLGRRRKTEPVLLGSRGWRIDARPNSMCGAVRKLNLAKKA